MFWQAGAWNSVLSKDKQLLFHIGLFKLAEDTEAVCTAELASGFCGINKLDRNEHQQECPPNGGCQRSPLLLDLLKD